MQRYVQRAYMKHKFIRYSLMLLKEAWCKKQEANSQVEERLFSELQKLGNK